MYLTVRVPKASLIPDGKGKEAQEADTIYGHEGLWMTATIPQAVGFDIGEGLEANNTGIACHLRRFCESTRLTGEHATTIITWGHSVLTYLVSIIWIKQCQCRSPHRPHRPQNNAQSSVILEIWVYCCSC